jgi:hypothetical protein
MRGAISKPKVLTLKPPRDRADCMQTLDPLSFTAMQHPVLVGQLTKKIPLFIIDRPTLSTL